MPVSERRGPPTYEELLSMATGKKARNEENNESHELLGNGDTEIFSTLIPRMKDLHVLKTCRLVCKSWNQFACRALRKLPRLFYSVDESDPDETSSHLKIIVGNGDLGLPSPFRIFKMEVTNLGEKCFLRILKYLRESATGCCMELHISSDDVDQAELQTMLTDNQKHLKITRLTLSGEIIKSSSGQNLFQPEEIRLPFLRKLGIWGEALAEERLVMFCENICRYSPLQSLTFGASTSRGMLKKVMSSLAKKPLERFHLVCDEPITSRDWKFICSKIMEIPHIKKLTMFPPDSGPGSHSSKDGHLATYGKLISHFADSLEYLKGHFPTLPVPDRCFPKLREIIEPPIDEFLHFPVDKYPVLKKVTVGTPCWNQFRYPDYVDPSPGIEVLGYRSPAVDEPDMILKFITSAGMVFPNVRSFSFERCGGIELTSAMLCAISTSFPKLTALELRVVLKDDRTLSGLRLKVDEWLNEDWPMYKIARETSLLDITGLEKLTLGPHVIITKHLFLYCLSKIQKLQYLTFYLTGKVSAVDIRDSVGHLTRIKIVVLKSINPKKQWVKEMERLRIMLPLVVEIKERTEELCKA